MDIKHKELVVSVAKAVLARCNEVPGSYTPCGKHFLESIEPLLNTIYIECGKHICDICPISSNTVCGLASERAKFLTEWLKNNVGRQLEFEF